MKQTNAWNTVYIKLQQIIWQMPILSLLNKNGPGLQTGEKAQEVSVPTKSRNDWKNFLPMLLVAYSLHMFLRRGLNF